MIVKLKNNYLFVITIILCFFCYFAFLVNNVFIPYFFVFIGLFLFINLIFATKKSFKALSPFFKTQSAKYLGLLILWIILGIIASIFTGKFYLKGFINNVIGNFLFAQILVFLTMIIALPRVMNFKNFSKLLLIMYFAIFSLGILEFFGDLFNIAFIQNFFAFIVNKRVLLETTRRTILTFGFPRISSIFQEPSYLAFFILISSPLVYNFFITKNKLFNNLNLDFFIKKTTFVLMVICLLLTQSPIFILFQFIIIVIALLKNRLIRKKKTLISISIGLMLVISSLILIYFAGFDILGKINLMETFISRIITTMGNLSMDKLVWAEPSLATRVGGSIASFHLFLDNPIAGVGYGNMWKIMPLYILKLSIPITPELYSCAIDNFPVGVGSILFKYLAEVGIVGIFLLYLFLGNLVFSINKKINSYDGIEKDLISGLKYSIFIIIFTSFYDSIFIFSILFIYLGLAQAMVIYNNNNSDFKVTQRRIRIDRS